MTQKDILTHALSFVELPYRGDAAAMRAARALCVIEWLHDMNWHPEADAIETKLDATGNLKGAVIDADQYEARANERDSIASFLNRLFGWGLETGGWQATQGTALVEELWGLINTIS